MDSTAKCFFDLSGAEKLQLGQDLWDDISPETVSVYDWQKEELAKRQVNLSQNPTSAVEWPEMRRRIRSRYDR